MRHGGYYYLFASLDYCCRGVNSDYRVVVGRATSITGPYVDRDGVAMLAGGGTELLRGYNEFRGPGGGDVFTDGRTDWFVHHYYDTADGGRTEAVRAPDLLARRLAQPRRPAVRQRPRRPRRRVLHRRQPRQRRRAGQPDLWVRGRRHPARRAVGRHLPAVAARRTAATATPSLLNRHSNKVAEVAACVNADGARVAQWGWLDNDCQKFRTRDHRQRLVAHREQAGRTGPGGGGCGGAGAPVQASTWLGNACQQFRFDPVGDVLIADTTGRLVLDVARCGGHHGGPLVAGNRRPSDCQLWRFAPPNEGYYRIVNRSSGRPITATTAADGSLRLTLGRRGETSAASQWRIEATDGGHRLVNRDGLAAELSRHHAGAGTPDGSGRQRLLLLTP